MLLAASESGKEIIITGDINANFLDKNDNVELKLILEINGFKQLVTKPTRFNITNNSASLIDVIASNNAQFINKIDVVCV